MRTKNRRYRWKARILAGIIAVTGVGGCQQQLFLEPSDHKTSLMNGLEHLERQPHAPIAPSVLTPTAPPASVLDPSRPPRYMTLKECIAIAVEKGNIGAQGGIQNSGFTNDSVPQFTGRQVAGTDTIRALVLDPAVVGADIERALSKFDARIITSLTWGKNDQPVVNFQQSFQNGDTFNLQSTLAKPLPTGGVAGITTSMNYSNLENVPAGFGQQPNPTYTPRIQFIFEQPLLQGFGIEINQLSTSHPGALLVPGLRPSGGQTTEGILITRIRYDQQKAEFDRQLNQLLLSVETAYWNLYSAYYNLYAQEETLRESYELYSILKKRLDAGNVRPADLSQTESQYWQFREAVLTARNQVLESERNLRGLLGETSFADGMRIVPVDEPTLAPFVPDYIEQATTALANRPELLIVRHDLKFRQLDLLLQKNQRRADLRFFGSYDIAGLGTRLDGREIGTPASGTGNQVPINALSSLANNNFNSYQFGLRLDMPLGFRDANAAVRQSQLNLVRSYYQLQDSERKVLEVVVQSWRNALYQYPRIEYLRMTRIKAQETLSYNRKLIEGGAWDVNTLFNILQVQQTYARSLAQEFQAVAAYNSALAALEFSKGTIQAYNSVSVSTGPLPPHVQKRAADHFSARNAALKLREQPNDPSYTALPAWQPQLENTPMSLGNATVTVPGLGFPVPAASPTIDGKPTKPDSSGDSEKPMPPATPPGKEPAPKGLMTGVSPWPNSGASAVPNTPNVNGTASGGFAVPVLPQSATGVTAWPPSGGTTFSSVGTVKIPSRRSPAADATATGPAITDPDKPSLPTVLPVSRPK